MSQPTDPLNGFVESPFPIAKGDEYSYAPYEWLRQRIYLLLNMDAGTGTLDDGEDWDLEDYEFECDKSPGSPVNAGWIIEFNSILYISQVDDTTYGAMKSHPPTDGDGVLDSGWWRRAFNYDHYHHADLNSALDEDTDRYYVNHRSNADPEYTIKLPYNKWLPRQFHPFEQVRPLASKNEAERQYTDTEILTAKLITGDINTNYTRDWLPESKGHAQQISEYLIAGAEPHDSKVGSQLFYDPKMGGGYQAMVIAVIEEAGNYFVSKVDGGWVTLWEDRPTNYASDWQAGLAYSAYDPIGGGGPSVVWDGLDGEGRIIIYSCIKDHDPSAAGNKPPNAEFWELGEWHPDKYEHVPYYARYRSSIPGIGTIEETVAESDAWGENNSAFEKCLNDIGHYDWWWDSTYPYRPQWLAYRRDNSGLPNTNWPLPVGCWRKCFRRSFGRPNDVAKNMMWPGATEPEGYDKGYILVTQAQYDAMPAGNDHFYKIAPTTSEIETAYANLDSTLKTELEARHAPVQYQYRGDDKYPEYEIHFEMLNDMYLVLNELKYYNGESTFDVTVEMKENNTDNTGAVVCTNSLAARASELGRITALAPKYTVDNGWIPNGYSFGVIVHYIRIGDDEFRASVSQLGVDYECWEWEGFAKIVTAITAVFKAGKDVGMHKQELLLRCAWCGMEGLDGGGEEDYQACGSRLKYSGSTIKVFDGTNVTEPPVGDDDYTGRFGNQYLDMVVDAESYFETQIVSDPPGGTFFDFEHPMICASTVDVFRSQYEWLMVRAAENYQHLYLIIVCDWSNYNSLNVFDLDWTNEV